MPLSDTGQIADPLAGLLGYQLRRASAVMMADLAVTLSAFGLSAAQASVLTVIAANPDATQSEVGRCLGIQRANMAPLIAGLAARALVVRSPVDGRSQALRLSEAGRALAEHVRDALETHEARFLPDCDPQMRVRLIGLLRQIRDTPTLQDAGEV